MRSRVSRVRTACLTTLLVTGAGALTACVPLDAAGYPEPSQQTQAYPPCRYDTCSSTPARTVTSAKSTVKPKR